MRSVRVLALLLTVVIPLETHVSGDPNPLPNPEGITRPEQELLTKYLLQKLLGKGDLATSGGEGLEATERTDDQDSSSSIVYPQVTSQRLQPSLRRLLDQAKENIDVIDFRKPSSRADRDQFYDDHVRHTRMPEDAFQDDRSRGSPSEAIPTFLPFPGTEPNRPSSRSFDKCSECSGESSSLHSRFSMPLTQLGAKKYYLGIFFKANWYKAEQYCRFHGMHLASINTADQQKDLEEHIESFGNEKQ